MRKSISPGAVLPPSIKSEPPGHLSSVLQLWELSLWIPVSSFWDLTGMASPSPTPAFSVFLLFKFPAPRQALSPAGSLPVCLTSNSRRVDFKVFQAFFRKLSLSPWGASPALHPNSDAKDMQVGLLCGPSPFFPRKAQRIFVRQCELLSCIKTLFQ